MPTGVLRDTLRHWQFWILELQFFGLLATTWLNLPRLVGSLSLSRRALAAPICASLVALGLTVFVAPRTSRIFYDEQIYQSIGQNLSDLRLAQMCNDGTVEYGSLQCARGEYNKEPYGYPYLLSVLYRVAGVHEGSAFVLNAVTDALFVLVVFFTTTMLVGRADAGAYAAIVAALMPEHLRWSHTAAAEPSAALACAFAVMTALAFVRIRTTGTLVWMVVATAFAVQFRTECVLIVPVVAAIVLTCAADELKTPRIWWAAAAALALVLVHIGHLVAVRNEGWGTTGPRISLAYAWGNLRSNGWFYLGDRRFPVIYTVLAIAGLVRGRLRDTAIPTLHFLLFWGIFVVFYAGSYDYGADDRFSLMSDAPLAMLAGMGASLLVDVLHHGQSLSLSRRAVVGLLGVQFLWYAPFVRAIGEEAWGARADVAFARAFVGELPRNSIVLTHNPNMFHVWGQSAAQASLATTESGFVDTNLRPRYAGGVFFHWNFWCNVADPVQQSFCTKLLERFPHTLIRESRERDYRYAVYRLDPPAAEASLR